MYTIILAFLSGALLAQAAALPSAHTATQRVAHGLRYQMPTAAVPLLAKRAVSSAGYLCRHDDPNDCKALPAFQASTPPPVQPTPTDGGQSTPTDSAQFTPTDASTPDQPPKNHAGAGFDPRSAQAPDPTPTSDLEQWDAGGIDNLSTAVEGMDFTALASVLASAHPETPGQKVHAQKAPAARKDDEGKPRAGIPRKGPTAGDRGSMRREVKLKWWQILLAVFL